MNSDSSKKEEVSQPKQEIKIEEKNPPKKEEPKKMGKIWANRINCFNNNNQTKKEVHKEEPKKPNNLIGKAKNIYTKNEITSGALKAQKPLSIIPEYPSLQENNHSNNINPNKINVMTSGTSIKPSTDNGNFKNKLNKISEMFKNRDGPGGKRPSMMLKMPQAFGFENESKGYGNSRFEDQKIDDIIKEEPDIMKDGYDPAANIQKNLDCVVIQKYKKKRRKTVFVA